MSVTVQSRPSPGTDNPVSSDQRPPYRGAYWVIPGKLLAGRYPIPTHASPDETDKVLTALLDAGIRSVFDLMLEEEISDHEPGEQYVHYEDRMEVLAQERDSLVEIQSHPIDADAPQVQELEFVLDAVDAELDGRDSPTLIHCSDGHGRAGLIVGCYLARHGIAAGPDVLTKIAELRAFDAELAEHKSPSNLVQERIVTRWKEGQ